MIVLRAIGGFFVKIGRWIKNTAWVQPLLIVGGIFAIIFSIPYITKWVQSWFASGDNAVTYYSGFKVSLENADKKESQADRLMDYMLNYDEYKSKGDSRVQEYGDKFFLTFVQEGCSGCSDAYKGFQTLQDNWNRNAEFTVEDGAPFKMHSIFIDTYKNNDDDKTLFEQYFLGQNYDAYFEEIRGDIEINSYYYVNQGGGSSTYASNLEKISDAENFETLTVFLVDFSNTERSNQMGVSEVLFSVDGKNGEQGDIAKARTLFDCWNGNGIFSKEYQK